MHVGDKVAAAVRAGLEIGCCSASKIGLRRMLSSRGKSLMDDLHKDFPPGGRIVISMRQMNTYLQVRTASLGFCWRTR